MKKCLFKRGWNEVSQQDPGLAAMGFSLLQQCGSVDRAWETQSRGQRAGPESPPTEVWCQSTEGAGRERLCPPSLCPANACRGPKEGRGQLCKPGGRERVSGEMEKDENIARMSNTTCSFRDSGVFTRICLFLHQCHSEAPLLFFFYYDFNI